MKLGDLPRSDPLNGNDPTCSSIIIGNVMVSYLYNLSRRSYEHVPHDVIFNLSIVIRELTRQVCIKFNFILLSTYLLVNVFCY